MIRGAEVAEVEGVARVEAGRRVQCGHAVEKLLAVGRDSAVDRLRHRRGIAAPAAGGSWRSDDRDVVDRLEDRERGLERHLVGCHSVGAVVERDADLSIGKGRGRVESGRQDRAAEDGRCQVGRERVGTAAQAAEIERDRHGESLVAGWRVGGQHLAQRARSRTAVQSELTDRHRCAQAGQALSVHGRGLHVDRDGQRVRLRVGQRQWRGAVVGEEERAVGLGAHDICRVALDPDHVELADSRQCAADDNVVADIEGKGHAHGAGPAREPSFHGDAVERRGCLVLRGVGTGCEGADHIEAAAALVEEALRAEGDVVRVRSPINREVRGVAVDPREVGVRRQQFRPAIERARCGSGSDEGRRAGADARRGAGPAGAPRRRRPGLGIGA